MTCLAGKSKLRPSRRSAEKNDLVHRILLTACHDGPFFSCFSLPLSSLKEFIEENKEVIIEAVDSFENDITC